MAGSQVDEVKPDLRVFFHKTRQVIPKQHLLLTIGSKAWFRIL